MGNAGLWFDKYCNTWNKNWTLSSENSKASDSGNENPKLKWIKSVANKGKVGDEGQLEEYAHQMALLVTVHGGKFEIFETESRFVTGLGLSHPIENGSRGIRLWVHHICQVVLLKGSFVLGQKWKHILYPIKRL